MVYRPDIDGLRAIAVLGVVLYHAYPSALPGGFVGVDVFFVISGYLITSIIYSGLIRSEFSFIEFYCSRVRRIYPALLIVVLFVEAVGYFGMLPDELKLLGRHSIGGMFFFSNIIFYFESGYFDVASHLKPLLHLWSLGVEEQYYLFWPLLLYLVFLRCGKVSLNFFISMLLAVSFLLGVVVVSIDKDAAFYLLPFRFWELAVGALLAIFIEPGINRIRSHEGKVYGFINSSVGCIGFFTIVSSFFFLSSDMNFPGYWAAAPVIGAMLVILSGANGWLNRYILSGRPLVFVGLISYPLYLWHWPILSYQTMFSSHAPSPVSRLLAVVLSFLLAFLTFKFVERKVRRWPLRPTVAVLIGFSFFVAMIGAGFNQVNLNPAPANMAHSDLRELRWPGTLARNEKCQAAFNYKGRFCALYNDYPVKVAVIGDSHANHFSPGLAKLYGESKVGLVNLGATGCAPVNNVPEFIADKGCLNIPLALDIVKKNQDIGTVYLAARWAGYSHHLVKLQSGLEETIQDLHRAGKKVVILDEVPVPKLDVRTCVKDRPFMLDQQSKDCSFDRQQYEKNAHAVREVLGQVSDKFKDVLRVDLLDQICSKRLCEGRYHGRLIYRDPTHLSMSGSLYAAYLIGLKLNSYSDDFIEVDAFNQKFRAGYLDVDPQAQVARP